MHNSSIVHDHFIATILNKSKVNIMLKLLL